VLDSVTNAFNQLPSAGTVTVGSVISILAPMVLTENTFAANPLTVPDEHGGAFGNSDSTSILSAFQEVQTHLNQTLAAISAKGAPLRQTFQFPSASGSQFTPAQIVSDILQGWNIGLGATASSVVGALVATEGGEVNTLIAQVDASVKAVIAELS
jgi:hypothetical protein